MEGNPDLSATEENFFDFIYIAETKETEPHPEGNESKKFKWFTYEELLEYEIKPHVKNTALAVLDYYRKLDKANTVWMTKISTNSNME